MSKKLLIIIFIFHFFNIDNYCQIVVSPVFHAVQYQSQEAISPIQFHCPDFPSFMDLRDANVYTTVQIGDQCWLGKNLMYLPQVYPSGEGSSIIPYYYVNGYEGFNNDDAKSSENYNPYGVLYNSPAAINACPQHWILPTDEDWKILERYLGIDEAEINLEGYRGTTEGGKLKSERTSPALHPRWDSPNMGATNTVGFNALPGGYRNLNATFANVGTYCGFKSAKDENSNNFYPRALLNGYSKIGRAIDVPENAYSVRCIKKSDFPIMDTDTTFLPDEVDECFQGVIEISHFPLSQVIESVGDINGICMNLEHSHLADLTIEIICPNGQSMQILNSISVGGVYLGEPIDDYSDEPGTGYWYCITPDAFETIEEAAIANTTLPEGIYGSFISFESLIGCPINGEWKLQICDHWAVDNGFLFGWYVEFDEE
jgi:uncharacterized protein (TIGR02145 family)